MWKALLKLLAPVLVAAVLLTGLLALGWATRESLRGQERYTVAFTGIDCPAPPGQERTEFLGEVQYLGGFPERLPLLEDDLAGRLAEAFGKHPWVAKVERVEVTRAAVRVRLVYRVPVLAVVQAGQTRAVDRDGVLLPASAPTAGLPVLHAETPPAGPAGTPWGDAIVKEKAGTVGARK